MPKAHRSFQPAALALLLAAGLVACSGSGAPTSGMPDPSGAGGGNGLGGAGSDGSGGRGEGEGTWTTHTLSLPRASVLERVRHSLPLDGDLALPLQLTVESGELPEGVEVSPEGVLEGAPRQSGAFEFTVVAEDASGRGARVQVDWQVRRPRWFLYRFTTHGNNTGPVHLVDLDDGHGEQFQLTPNTRHASHHAFSQDGKWLVLLLRVIGEEASELHVVDLEEEAPELGAARAELSGTISSFSLSPDGAHAAVVVLHEEVYRLLLIETASQAAPRELYSGPTPPVGPSFTWNSRWLTFRDASQQLFAASLEESGTQPLELGGATSSPLLVGDACLVYLDGRDLKRAALGAGSADVSTTPQPDTGTLQLRAPFQSSGSGLTRGYVSLERTIAGGTHFQVIKSCSAILDRGEASGFGYSSPDRRFQLHQVLGEESKATLHGPEGELLGFDDTTLVRATFSEDGALAVFVREESDNLVVVDLRTGEPSVTLGSVPSVEEPTNLYLSPDRRWLSVASNKLYLFALNASAAPGEALTVSADSHIWNPLFTRGSDWLFLPGAARAVDAIPLSAPQGTPVPVLAPLEPGYSWSELREGLSSDGRFVALEQTRTGNSMGIALWNVEQENIVERLNCQPNCSHNLVWGFQP